MPLITITTCENKNKKIVKYGVKYGVNVNKMDKSNCTPLNNVYKNGHKNLVKYLIEHGSNANQEGIYILHLIIHVKLEIII